MNRADPLTTASAIIARRYEGAAVTFLAGSVVRGEDTDTSDLDLVVVYERIDAAFRDSFIYAGWPVEAFVHDRKRYDISFCKWIGRAVYLHFLTWCPPARRCP